MNSEPTLNPSTEINIIVGEVRTLEISDTEFPARFVEGTVPVKIPRNDRTISNGRINAILFSKTRQEIMYHVKIDGAGSKPITREQLQDTNPNIRFSFTIQEEGENPVQGTIDENVTALREKLFGALFNQRKKWCEWLGINEDKVKIELNDITTTPENLTWLRATFTTTGDIIAIQSASGSSHEIGSTKQISSISIQNEGRKQNSITITIQFTSNKGEKSMKISLDDSGATKIAINLK